MRLIGGSDSLSGRVEICRQNEWGTICDRTGDWGAEEATVVCRQLGFSAEGKCLHDQISKLATSQIGINLVHG